MQVTGSNIFLWVIQNKYLFEIFILNALSKLLARNNYSKQFTLS